LADIDKAKGIKVGTYTRGALLGGSLFAGPWTAITVAVLTHPTLVVSALEKFGGLSRAISNKMFSGEKINPVDAGTIRSAFSKLSEKTKELFSKVKNENVNRRTDSSSDTIGGGTPVPGAPNPSGNVSPKSFGNSGILEGNSPRSSNSFPSSSIAKVEGSPFSEFIKRAKSLSERKIEQPKAPKVPKIEKPKELEPVSVRTDEMGNNLQSSVVESKNIQEPAIYSRLSSRDAIAKQLEKDGFDVSTTSSNSPGSKSEYITVTNDFGDSFKIRISDHELPIGHRSIGGGAGDFEIGTPLSGRSTADGLYNKIILKIGKPNPVKVAAKKLGIEIFEDEGRVQSDRYGMEKLELLNSLKKEFGGVIEEFKTPDGKLSYSLEDIPKQLPLNESGKKIVESSKTPSLLDEAKKYKSAEEFFNSLEKENKLSYHGTPEQFEKFDLSKMGKT
jgi:hypothetical protein